MTDIQGFCDEQFAAVRETFEKNFREKGDVGREHDLSAVVRDDLAHLVAIELVDIGYRRHRYLFIFRFAHLAQAVIKSPRAEKETAVHDNASFEAVAQAVLSQETKR